MKTIRLIVASGLAAALLGCSSRHIAYHFTDAALKPERLKQSVPLFLPRTVLEFRATCELELASGSPLYVEAVKEDADRRFDTNQLFAAAERIEVKVATSGSKAVKLKDPTLGVRGERDPKELFLVHLDNAFLTAVDFDAEFAPDGVIGSISSTRQNQALEFTLKMLESAATIAGNVMKIATVEISDEPPKVKVPKDNVPGKLADKVLEVRKQRNNLRFKAGERAGLDGAALSRLLDDLDREEAALLAAFTGKTKTLSTPIQVTIRPARNQPVSEVVLVNFDEDGGISRSIPASPLVTAATVPPDFLGRSGKSADRIVLYLTPQDEADKAALAKLGETRNGGRLGLPYQIPARIPASVAFVNAKGVRTQLLATDLLIGQWGEVARLPVSMGTPGSTIKPIYFTESGALKKVTVASKPPSTDSVKSLSTASGSITDALKATADKEAAAAKTNADKQDELNKLKREADILEQMIRLQGLKDRLPPGNAKP